jgi:hypothetical protein
MPAERNPLHDWHRLFGLSWIDFFQNSPIDVETEIDLSLKQQFIDLVLIRRGPEPILRPLPDGFENLAAHNLITFKSHHEALDGWSLSELVGHYVNYRKQSSPSMQNLLPESDYRLFAVCARYPLQLSQQVALTAVRDAVYDVRWGTVPIRVIVVSQLPQEKQNAMLHLFSAREELLRYGQRNYQPYSRETSTLLFELFTAYNEDSDMSDKKLKEFVRESVDKFLAGLSTEERLKGLPAEELRNHLPIEERLKGLSMEEVVQALPPETLAALARHLRTNVTSPKPQ